MFDFTDDYLSLMPGTIRLWSTEPDPIKAGSWSIKIPLAPFSAEDSVEPHSYRLGMAGPQIIDTWIRLDFIYMSASRLEDLSNKSVAFPVNPADGYIDGTIYLGGAHNPVDVIRIVFGRVGEGRVCAELHTSFDFTQERVEINNRAAVLHAALRDVTDESR